MHSSFYIKLVLLPIVTSLVLNPLYAMEESTDDSSARAVSARLNGEEEVLRDRYPALFRGETTSYLTREDQQALQDFHEKEKKKPEHKVQPEFVLSNPYEFLNPYAARLREYTSTLDFEGRDKFLEELDSGIKENSISANFLFTMIFRIQAAQSSLS